MTITTIDIHVLQTVPPSNINRDDTGSPKTARYGGVQRARVSSQTWKRATRREFAGFLEQGRTGFRSRLWAGRLGARIAELSGLDEAEANALAVKVLVALKTMKDQKVGRTAKGTEEAALPETDSLLFLSAVQLESLAAFAAEKAAAGVDIGAADSKTLRQLVNVDHSVDIALFGRMLAENAELNVDASVQVAHAISVHAVDNEADYYTAVDDFAPADNRGAGMIGVVEFNSSTLYRYATVNVPGLIANLGDGEAAAAAAGAFVRAFITSMPTGKQNTFANRTLPSVVVVALREDAPVNLVGAFEDPVTASEGTSRTALAAARLAAHAVSVDAVYGTPAREVRVLQVGDQTDALTSLGTPSTLNDIVAAVEESVRRG